MTELHEPIPHARVRQMTEAAELFAQNLEGPGMEYLETRGLGGIAKQAGLGYVPEDVPPEWERYRHMLSLPYRTLDGEVVSIRFRTIDADDPRPKYLQPPGSELCIYNMPALANPTSSVCITEGELEALTLMSQGYTAIGIPGANAWKRHYSRALDGFPIVIAWGDPDEAGKKFNEEILSSIRRATTAHMSADINDTAQTPMGFAEIAQAFGRAGGKN